jgi:hypothetical protein
MSNAENKCRIRKRKSSPIGQKMLRKHNKNIQNNLKLISTSKQKMKIKSKQMKIRFEWTHPYPEEPNQNNPNPHLQMKKSIENLKTKRGKKQNK